MMRSMSRTAFALACLLGCHGSAKPTTTATPAAEPANSTEPAKTGEPAKPDKPKGLAGWELPAKWRAEVIPFPLDFAPSIAHRGFEELRFPPGFFDPKAGDYWSYAFVWRTDDAANLDAKAVGDELTVYFRGLIAAVDEKRQITARDSIVASAEKGSDGSFALRAHVFDAFKTAQPLDLTGWAERRACGTGALWIFVLAPARTTIRSQLDAIARGARC